MLKVFAIGITNLVQYSYICIHRIASFKLLAVQKAIGNTFLKPQLILGLSAFNTYSLNGTV